MSKKDFEVIAGEIKPRLAELKRINERNIALMMVAAIARACKQQNPAFNTERFFNACGATDPDL